MAHSHTSSRDFGTHLSCKSCDGIFVVCRLCYRGQVYCSVTCRRRARRLKQRGYARTYAASTEAMALGRARQKRYRERMRRDTVTEHARPPQGPSAQGVGEKHPSSDSSKSVAGTSRYSGRTPSLLPLRPVKRRRSAFFSCRHCGEAIRWLPAVPFDVRTQFNARHFGQRRVRLKAVSMSARRGF